MLDLEDYENPIKRIFNTPYTRTSNDLYKDYQIFVKKSFIKTDKGWIYPEIVEKSFLSVAQDREIVISNNDTIPGDHMFGSFSLKVNNLQQVFERKYDKIQDVLSNLGKGY